MVRRQCRLTERMLRPLQPSIYSKIDEVCIETLFVDVMKRMLFISISEEN